MTVCSGCSEGQGGQQNFLEEDRGKCTGKGILGKRGKVAKPRGVGTQKSETQSVLSAGDPRIHRYQELHIQEIQEEDLICK